MTAALTHRTPPGSADTPAPACRTVLALDFGLRSIGVAWGDTRTGIAQVRPAIPAGEGRQWQALQREVRSLEPDVLVVGIPCQADGTEAAFAPAARQFAQALQQRFDRPVSCVDERGSSLEASARLAQARSSGARRRRVRREDIDSLAAVIILERWLAGERLAAGPAR